MTSSSFKLKIAFSQFFHNGFVPNCQKNVPNCTFMTELRQNEIGRRGKKVCIHTHTFA